MLVMSIFIHCLNWLKVQHYFPVDHSEHVQGPSYVWCECWLQSSAWPHFNADLITFCFLGKASTSCKFLDALTIASGSICTEGLKHSGTHVVTLLRAPWLISVWSTKTEVLTQTWRSRRSVVSLHKETSLLWAWCQTHDINYQTPQSWLPWKCGRELLILPPMGFSDLLPWETWLVA